MTAAAHCVSRPRRLSATRNHTSMGKSPGKTTSPRMNTNDSGRQNPSANDCASLDGNFQSGFSQGGFPNAMSYTDHTGRGARLKKAWQSYEGVAEIQGRGMKTRDMA